VKFYTKLWEPAKHVGGHGPPLEPPLRGKWNGARVTLQKCPWKPVCRKYGYYAIHGCL